MLFRERKNIFIPIFLIFNTFFFPPVRTVPIVSLISSKCQEKEPLLTRFFEIIAANTALVLSYNCFSFRASLKTHTFVTLCQFQDSNCYQIPYL